MRRVIRWSLWVLVGVIGLFALMAVIGAFLPKAHQAEVRFVLPAPPEAVETALLEVRAYPSWRPWVQSVEAVEDRGEGTARTLSWVEVARSGQRVPCTLTEYVPQQLIVVRTRSEGLGFWAEWRYALEPAPEGTRVRLQERGEIDSALMRFFYRVFGDPADGVRLIQTALEARFSGEDTATKAESFR